jgi:hypothetical protein
LVRKSPDKAFLGQKKPLGISVGSDYLLITTSVQGWLAPSIVWLEARILAREPVRVKGSNKQVRLSAMAERAALLATAKRTKA